MQLDQVLADLKEDYNVKSTLNAQTLLPINPDRPCLHKCKGPFLHNTAHELQNEKMYLHTCVPSEDSDQHLYILINLCWSSLDSQGYNLSS